MTYKCNLQSSRSQRKLASHSEVSQMFIAKAIIFVAMTCATLLVASVTFFALNGLANPVILVALIPYAFIWIMLLVYGIE